MLADHLALDLPMSATAPALARRAMEQLGLHEAAHQTASLLVSELVSNALGHSGADAGDPIHLRASVSDGALRISVTDAGAGFEPMAQSVEPGSRGGFGLYLVEQLSDAWGVRRTARTTVWFVIALDPA